MSFAITDRPPSLQIMRKLGLEPDPWQIEVLDSDHTQLLLNCSRQAGKSTVVAILGLVHALFKPYTRVLLVSRSHRQSKELLRQMSSYHQLLGARLLKRRTAEELEFTHGSRIVSAPCKEETIRGFAHVDILVIDEAARVPDDLYRAVRPMLAVSNGRLICLSTPYGRRGFFWNAWAKGGDDWARIEIPAAKIPRIKPEFLEQERRALGESWFRQEYCCSFEALEGLVFPDFKRCVVPELPANLQFLLTEHDGKSKSHRDHARLQSEHCRRVGGIDFGFRNPFAAVWGVLDADNVLWLTGEHYCRQRPLSHHAQCLPHDVIWYADPSGASETSELRCAGFIVKKGANALRPGIAALSGRLENGTLRVLKGRCPNLLAEAALYRYGTSERRDENPLDEHNHALAALRYLISRIDAHRMAGRITPPQESAAQTARQPWQDERLWTPIES